VLVGVVASCHPVALWRAYGMDHPGEVLCYLHLVDVT